MKVFRRALAAVSVPAVALLAVLMFSPTSALATNTNTNRVEIQYDAQYDTAGFQLQVGLLVTCRKGTVPNAPGQVMVDVEQSPPETPTPVAWGSGLNNVVCDGKPHYATLTINGAGFDGGRARATATLIPPVGGGSSVEVARDIFIVAN